jgi:hypothetical protein
MSKGVRARVLIPIIILLCYNKMKIVFESVLLFSLAVLVIAVGLLVYYFKNRISDLETKNTKCLEIVNDVYSQHNQLKAEVAHLANRTSIMASPHPLASPKPAMTYYREDSDNIQFHVDEGEDGDYDDNEEDGDYDQEQDDDVKIVNVDLSGPVDSDINIADEIEDTDPYENVEVDELVEEQAKEPSIVKIDVHDSDLESDNESRSELDNESRTELDNDSRLEQDNESRAESRSEAFRELFNPATKDNYKKMDVRSLRQLVITRGLATDNTARMKKNELIDILLTIV